MLQQTTVAAVMGYYSRFLERFPDVQALATASADDVLHSWSGLGYYRRARNLQAAARAIVAGKVGFPRTAAEIELLPGVGRYTACAVASLAFGQRVPVVEANSARVLARLFAITQPLSNAATKARCWELATSLVPLSGIGEHNNAIMEIGSLVCTPSNPRCGDCPVASHCLALAHGLTDAIPASQPKRGKVAKWFAAVVVRSGPCLLMRRIPEGEWHAGMWEFPKVEVAPGASDRSRRNAVGGLIAPLCRIGPLRQAGEFRYAVTHHTVGLTVYRAESREASPATDGFYWVDEADVSRLPLPSVQKKVAQQLGRGDHPPADKR